MLMLTQIFFLNRVMQTVFGEGQRLPAAATSRGPFLDLLTGAQLPLSRDRIRVSDLTVKFMVVQLRVRILVAAPYSTRKAVVDESS